jgi:gamma-glutamyltranspeptidase / glutathione hydrolase / leukotriene-C4 hydrolase
MTTKQHNISTYRRGAVLTGITVEEDGLIYANSDWRKTGNVAGIDEVD